MKYPAIKTIANTSQALSGDGFVYIVKQTVDQEGQHVLVKVEERQANYIEFVLANLALTV